MSPLQRFVLQVSFFVALEALLHELKIEGKLLQVTSERAQLQRKPDVIRPGLCRLTFVAFDIENLVDWSKKQKKRRNYLQFLRLTEQLRSFRRVIENLVFSPRLSNRGRGRTEKKSTKQSDLIECIEEAALGPNCKHEIKHFSAFSWVE